MRPTLHLGLFSGTPDLQWVTSGPIQGFDALRIICQIVSLQCLHYLALALVLPPILSLLALNKPALHFQGGAASLSLLLDWREIAGQPIIDGGRPWPWGQIHYDRISIREKDVLEHGLATSAMDQGYGIRYWWEWEAFLEAETENFIKIKSGNNIAWDGRQLGLGSLQESAVQSVLQDYPKDGAYDELGWWFAFARDPSRGWAIVFAWAVAGIADVFLLSMLVRRPTHILDHTLTLQAIHLGLTWFYTRNFPSSLFYWLVMAAHTGASVVWAEALSIRRELRLGFRSGLEGNTSTEARRSVEEERSGLLEESRTTHNANPHVLFDESDVDDHNDLQKRQQAHGNVEKIEMKRLD